MARENEAKLEYFAQVNVKKPSDVIIDQIRTLIRDGKLRPGDALPSERVLAERFGVGRAQVREALKRLEFYGILRTEPNKGSVVASLGIQALEGIISTVLHLDRGDVRALFETRAILETAVVRLASIRANGELLETVREAHERFRDEVRQGRRALEQDHVFHLKIAEAAGNSILASLVSLLTPDVIMINRDADDPQPQNREEALSEHEAIVQALDAHDSERAVAAMQRHMDNAFVRRFGESPSEQGR